MAEYASLDALLLFFLWSYKITTLVIGYLFVRHGMKLFVQGTTGEFNFGMEIKGAKATLVSASPGLFLVLMGTVVIGIGLYKGLDLEITRSPQLAPAVRTPAVDTISRPPEPPQVELPQMPRPKE